MKEWARKQPGFTIVELLIVIVVIAILAAISIVAYNGIQERARLSAAKSFASQMKKRDTVDAQGYWAFDECSGSTVANTAGNSVAGSQTITGTVAWSTDTPYGQGCSLVFNGSSTYIDSGLLLSNEYYMKSAWIKSSSAASAQNIISALSGSANNAAFYLSNGSVSGGHNSGWNSVTSGTAQNDGKWHHVALEFTRNGTASNGTLKLYVDGVVVAALSTAPLIADLNHTQAIGRFGTGSYFNGLLDDVMIITR